MFYKFWFFLLFLSIFHIGCAQDLDSVALDNFIEVMEAQHKFNGSVAIAKKGDIIYRKSVGFIDFKSKTPVEANSQFRIGSVTKTFTAVLIMKAVEEGKLRLDQTLSDFFPDIPNAEQITVEMLLRHRSGLMEPSAHPELFKLRYQSLSRDKIIQMLNDSKSEFEPNEKTSYNNTGYILLTFILEDISNKTFAELLKEQITDPLGLKNTYYRENQFVLNNKIKSYRYTKDGYWKELSKTDASVTLGAGAMISTASDLVVFIHALFNKKLVSEESFDHMKNLIKRYGLGLTNREYSGITGLGHAGRIDGHNALVLYFEDSGISYALVSNISNTKTEEVSEGIHDILYGNLSQPISRKAKTVDLKQYEGTYVSVDNSLKVTVWYAGKVLMVSVPNRENLTLIPVEEDVFKIDLIKATVIFNSDKNQATLEYGNKKIILNKE